MNVDRKNATYEFKRYMRDGSVLTFTGVVRTKKKPKVKNAV